MQFKLTFVALAAAIAALTAQAAPTTLEPHVGPGGRVFVCTDANFAGDCTNYGVIDDQCSNFPLEFNDDIPSFGPDVGWSCTMFIDFDCTGGGIAATNPGYETLPDGLNDVFSSVLCQFFLLRSEYDP